MDIITILQVAINVFLLSSGILLLFISLLLWFAHLSDIWRLVGLSLFVLSCSLWFLIETPLFGADAVNRSILETADVLCQYGITFFSLMYAHSFLKGWRRWCMRFCQLWAVIYVAGTNLLQCFTALEYKDFMPVGAASNAVFIGVMGACIGWEAIREKSEDARNLIFSAIPALLGGLLEIGNYLRGSKAPVTLLFFIGFLLFVLMQVFCFIRYLQKQAQQKAKLEVELMNSRISIMLSQIQPHFLYNSLTGIKLLCDIDPPRASEALEHFSFYLRGNLDSLVNTRLVPFEKELVHIRDYLYLEKMRFPQKLNIVWEILDLDFVLPPLTVQPLIENAIRHGINKKAEGGTLTIRTERLADEVLITVRDDGIGFDPAEKNRDGRSHVGIENTRARLSAFCAGSLLIESERGSGTAAKISLPLEAPAART